MELGATFFAEVQLAFELPPGRVRRKRNADRVAVAFSCQLRRSGAAAVDAKIMDLSPTGFCVETHLDLSNGADLWLRLPGLESRHATVIWSRSPRYGCAFSEPLHPAVFSMVVERQVNSGER